MKLERSEGSDRCAKRSIATLSAASSDEPVGLVGTSGSAKPETFRRTGDTAADAPASVAIKPEASKLIITILNADIGHLSRDIAYLRKDSDNLQGGVHLMQPQDPEPHMALLVPADQLTAPQLACPQSGGVWSAVTVCWEMRFPF